MRSLCGVYGPMLIMTQHYVIWGVAITFIFTLVWLPFTIGASWSGRIELVIAANLAYDCCHFAFLYWHVHFRTVVALEQLVQEDSKYDSAATEVAEEAAASTPGASMAAIAVPATPATKPAQ